MKPDWPFSATREKETRQTQVWAGFFVLKSKRIAREKSASNLLFASVENRSLAPAFLATITLLSVPTIASRLR